MEDSTSVGSVTKKLFNQQIKKWEKKNRPPKLPTVEFQKLSEKQKIVIQKVSDHIAMPILEQLNNNFKILLVGSGGTGKSETLLYILQLLEEKRKRDSNFDYIASSLTGMSSNLLGINTIHNSFGVALYENYNDLQLQKAENSILKPNFFNNEKHQRLRKVRILVFEEYSLIGLRLLSILDKMMRMADPTRSNMPFAGRGVIFAGDYFQALPIMDIAAFYPCSRQRYSQYLQLSLFYKSVEDVVILDKSYRQAGETDRQQTYREFLNRVKRHQCNMDDLAMVQKRQINNLEPDEKLSFSSALHVFPFRLEVADYNRKCLHKKFPLQQIVTISQGNDKLEIAIGCPVYLTTNICVSVALTNGTYGIVRDIVYAGGKSDPPEEGGKVEMILVDFPSYTGGKYVVSEIGVQGVPIYKKDTSECDEKTKRTLIFKKFPLVLGYGMTCHKVQGQTLDKIAFQLGSSAFACGLDYVLFSRIKNEDCMMILDKSTITLERLNMGHTNANQLQQWEDKRLTTKEKIFLRKSNLWT